MSGNKSPGSLQSVTKKNGSLVPVPLQLSKELMSATTLHSERTLSLLSIMIDVWMKGLLMFSTFIIHCQSFYICPFWFIWRVLCITHFNGNDSDPSQSHHSPMLGNTLISTKARIGSLFLSPVDLLTTVENHKVYRLFLPWSCCLTSIPCHAAALLPVKS